MKIILSGICLLVSLCVCSQNTYHTAVTISTEGQWLRSTAAQVANANTRLLLYQADGASLTLSCADIGGVSSLNGAGHYDLN